MQTVPSLRQIKSRLREARDAWRARTYVHRAHAHAGLTRPFRRALVLPAAGHGSLGDEAMLLASGQVFRKHGIERLTILSYGPNAPWPPVGEFDDVLSFGSSYSVDFWQTCEQLLAEFSTATHMLIQGADVMDGFYNPSEAFRRATYARLATAAGLRATIGGFSFNASPHPRCVRTLASLPADIRLVARDPVSWRRLTSRLRRPVHIGADMAFLLEPATDQSAISPYLAWIRRERSEGRLILGINANYLVALDRDGDDAAVIISHAYAHGVIPLLTASEPVSLLLIPHDHRAMAGRCTDLELLDRIRDQLPAEHLEHVRIVRERIDASEVKSLVGQLDAVFTGRMHLAIAALGQGIPAAGVTYQGKFEGLFEHFELTGLELSPSAMIDGALPAFLHDLMSRRDADRLQIKNILPAVRRLAWENFDNLIGTDEASS